MDESDTDDEIDVKLMKGRRGDDFRINKYVVYLFLGIIVILLILVIKNELRQNSYSNIDDTTISKPTCKQLIFCKDPFRTATKGKWVNNLNLSTPWIQESVQAIRRKLNLPENMTRDDMRCGHAARIPNTRLPALCNPNNDELYCCSETSGWCGSTEEHCAVRGGFNTKLKVPLAQAEWKSDEKQCKIYKFDQNEACKLLNKDVKKIVFLGDSQARHLFTTLILFLSGNYKNGAIKKVKKADKYVMSNCTHEYQLLNKNCRHHLVKTSVEVENFCNGEYTDFKVEYLPDYQTFLGKRSTQMITDLQKEKNTFVIVSAGTHFNSDYNSFINYYLRSMMDTQGRAAWPKLIIETLPNVYAYKSNEKRWIFNQEIENTFHHGMFLFDNKLLTDNLESHDGRTYGLKFNLLKVHILLHYFYNLNPRCA